MNRPTLIRRLTALTALAGIVLLAAPQAMATDSDSGPGTTLAQAGGTEPRELEPRYKPVPPEPKSSYNSSYIFGMTRGVADSTIHPAGKVPLFLLTVPLDLVLFPFAAIGGFFG